MNSNLSVQVISPQQFETLVATFIDQPRPEWSKWAIARVLNVMFPRIKTSEWNRLLDSSKQLSEKLAKTEMPWLWGRLSRVLAELRALNLQNASFFQQIPWLFTLNARTGELTGGTGLEGAIQLEIEKMFSAPVENQKRFWCSFSDGFSQPMMPRPQDTRAMLTYVVLAVNWSEAKQCASIRALYDFVHKKIPKPVCPPHLDPVDFEVREIKWFEKLCHRNLGLRLAPRGRPRKKIPQR